MQQELDSVKRELAVYKARLEEIGAKRKVAQVSGNEQRLRELDQKEDKLLGFMTELQAKENRLSNQLGESLTLHFRYSSSGPQLLSFVLLRRVWKLSSKGSVSQHQQHQQHQHWAAAKKQKAVLTSAAKKQQPSLRPHPRSRCIDSAEHHPEHLAGNSFNGCAWRQ